jgi:hypothetical protein
MAAWGWSKSKILKEIEKCEILCANYHRMLHHEEKINHSHLVEKI